MIGQERVCLPSPPIVMPAKAGIQGLGSTIGYELQACRATRRAWTLACARVTDEKEGVADNPSHQIVLLQRVPELVVAER